MLRNDTPGLIDALTARLDRREVEVKATTACWYAARGVHAVTDAAIASGLAEGRYEQTRRALCRAKRRMPYWQIAKINTAELAAEGWFFTPAGALTRNPARAIDAPAASRI